MKNTIRLFSIVVLLLALPNALIAQEWSAEQQEVWKDVEEGVNHFYSGNMEECYKFVHPDFVFWNSDNSVPGNRDTAYKLDTTWYEKLGGKWHSVSLTPLTILVFDDFAVVNFYVRGFVQEPGGQPVFTTIRWLNVLKKEDGKWLVVANYGHSENASGK